MLKAGDRAPDFELPADDGGTVRLPPQKGRRAVVYFYPKDDTPGCTVEAIEFTRAMGKLHALGIDVYGISKDTIQSHCKFRDKHALKVRLLSDPDLTVHKAFGAYGEKNMYGNKVLGTIRSTFLIAKDGTIEHAWPSVKVQGHVDAVVAAAGGEAAPKKPATAKKAASAKTPATAKKKAPAAPKKKAAPKKSK
jgi:peroxiredoxin Q/BCP